MVCDLAETYQIYDYRGLSPQRVAVLLVGLREDSRVKMKISGSKLTLDQTLLAGIADRLTMLSWQFSKSAQNGEDHPLLILERLNMSDEEIVKGFESPESFQETRKRILEGVQNGN